MIRNLKALGLALVAVFAMGGLSASAASATDLFTKTGGGTALLTGVSHDNAFEFGGGSKFECTTSRFAGTITNGASEMTVDMEYSGTKNVTPHTTHCSGTGGQMTYDINGCHYIWTGNTTGEDPPAVGKDATVWIQCPAGKVIQITQPGTGITKTILPQTPTSGGVTYTNLPNHPGGAAVKVTVTITGLTYICHGFACHFGTGTHGFLKYTGTVTLTGYQDLKSAGEPITPVKEGAQVGVSFS